MAGDEPSTSAPATTSPPSSSSGSGSLSEQLATVTQVQAQASAAMDSAIQATTRALGAAVALALQQGKEAKAMGCAAWKEGQAYVDQGLAQAQALENEAVAHIKTGVLTVASLPTYILYPTLGVTTMLALPFTRRALYNMTLGRLRTPESIARASQGRVEGLKGKLDEVSSEAQKLAERMRSAEEEMR